MDVIIIGAGPIGKALIRPLIEMGHHPVVVDAPHPERLIIPLESKGGDAVEVISAVSDQHLSKELDKRLLVSDYVLSLRPFNIDDLMIADAVKPEIQHGPPKLGKKGKVKRW